MRKRTLVNKSKNNLAVIISLGRAEELKTNAQLASEALGGVTMSKRVMVSNVIKRLTRIGYVVGYKENHRVHLYELTLTGEKLYLKWRPVLRRCRLCDRTAKTEEELTLFVRDKRGKHGYAQLCRRCTVY